MNQTPSNFTPRHWIALTSVITGLVALYLHLWKLGYMGPLTCNAQHSCEIAMTSQWGMFWGVDVALIGVIGYSLLLITSIVGLQPRWINDRRITILLGVLAVIGFLFTVRLKYYEWFVMKLFCRWCAISAVVITTHVVAVGMDWRRVGRAMDAGGARG
ncbi:MAG TPA: vitamin K epoxide reductase family protein [Gemmatimonadales bacterium]|jgi:uncharacterized membrane protein